MKNNNKKGMAMIALAGIADAIYRLNYCTDDTDADGDFYYLYRFKLEEALLLPKIGNIKSKAFRKHSISM